MTRATVNQLKTVKLACVDEWRPLMPAHPITGEEVTVSYAWPGAALQGSAAVWTVGGRTVSVDNAIKAGRRWRRVETTFDVVAEVYLKGRTNDGRLNILQQEADDFVEQITGTIDDWIADNVRLTFDQPNGDIFIDWATFDSVTLEHGPTADGAAARHICEITYQARLR